MKVYTYYYKMEIYQMKYTTKTFLFLEKHKLENMHNNLHTKKGKRDSLGRNN